MPHRDRLAIELRIVIGAQRTPISDCLVPVAPLGARAGRVDTLKVVSCRVNNVARALASIDMLQIVRRLFQS
jgi:hypothetical protein